ncbi:MAG: hypothetical protein QOG53_2894 [Frankiales bacterium]|jgi:hypothetical protein|nr:hypothetical protein [Frankiales bacterium]
MPCVDGTRLSLLGPGIVETIKSKRSHDRATNDHLGMTVAEVRWV